MTLKDKRKTEKDIEMRGFHSSTNYYPEEDVKESIKRLLNKFKKMGILSSENIKYEFKNEFGKELLK